MHPDTHNPAMPMTDVEPISTRTNVIVKNSGFKLSWAIAGLVVLIAWSAFMYWKGSSMQYDLLTLDDDDISEIEANNAELSGKVENLNKELGEITQKYEANQATVAAKDQHIEFLSKQLEKQPGETQTEYRDRYVNVCIGQSTYTDKQVNDFEQTRLNMENNRARKRHEENIGTDPFGVFINELF